MTLVQMDGDPVQVDVSLGHQHMAPPYDLLQEVYTPILPALEALQAFLPQGVPAETQSAQEALAYLFADGGKRIRPALFFLISRMVGYQGPHLISMAAVCEYIHTASLLHDDVVDNSSLRRNKPTVCARWGDESAVLVGDLIYATASCLMAETGNLEVVKVFSHAIQRMSEGELLQLETLFQSTLSQATYYRILEAKTGVLIGASCKSAGLLGGCSLETCEALGEFGLYVGVAYQLIDDALDYLSPEATLGKNAQADLLEGRITLPILLLQEVVSESEAQWMHALFQQVPFEPQAAHQVMGLVQKYKTAELAIEQAEVYTQRALGALKRGFPDPLHHGPLAGLVSALLKRKM